MMDNAYTGRNIRPLLPHMVKSINKARRMRFIVSFIMDSGVNALLPALKSAISRGADLKILTSDYMGITEPNALYRLLFELLGVKINIFDNDGRSFHPKTYIFEYDRGGEIIIGSSNLSGSALKDGIEWNYRFNSSEHGEDFDIFCNEFNELFEKNSFALSLKWLREYHKRYRKADRSGIIYAEEEEVYQAVGPVNFQVPALYELSRTREEGYDKAMIIAATGLGKTYLAAFDTLNYSRILFIAHREEILHQAIKSFKKVHKNKSMGLFKAEVKDINSDMVFASVQSLGKKEYLNDEYFSKDYFDYVIVDEFHHSVCDSYVNIINYFKPRFLLGMTATPDRMDNRDVYKICDYNIAFECDFKTGINNDWLSPFKYYGFYDDIDYNRISFRNGRYDPKELEVFLVAAQRAGTILREYENYCLKKTVAFCSGIKHCDFMDSFFKRNGIRSAAIHSNTPQRQSIIESFGRGDIDIVFVVDIFNEGIDIPDIKSLMFLRPTESYTIFMQQLGRGMRKSKDKDYLLVLDFVGNYKGANLKPFYLAGHTPYTLKAGTEIIYLDRDLPENCSMDLDFRLIDLFKKMAKEGMTRKEMLKREYFRIKDILVRKPRILDIFEGSNYPVGFYLKTFGSWSRFLSEMGELSEEEQKLIGTSAGRFLEELEKTSMTKSLKIPILLSLIDDNRLRTHVGMDDILNKFRDFYGDNLHYAKDFRDKSNADILSWDDSRLKAYILKNPIYYLHRGKSREFFEYDQSTEIFSLSDRLIQDLPKDTGQFVLEYLDRVNYRLKDYFRRKFAENE